jgi:nitrous oxidase accessory protein NosD
MRYLGNIKRLSLVVLSSLAVPAWGATLCVTVGGQFGCYAHISAAVTAANAGDVILVGPGTYHESVVITKPLTLGSFGATIDATGLKARPSEPGSERGPDLRWSG